LLLARRDGSHADAPMVAFGKRKRMDMGSTTLVENDAVDGAHSAASRCHRVVASNSHHLRGATAVISRVEIPRRSSLRLYRAGLSFESGSARPCCTGAAHSNVLLRGSLSRRIRTRMAEGVRAAAACFGADQY